MADWSGFYRLSRRERLERVARFARLAPADRRTLSAPSALGHAASGRFIENSAGSFPLPLGFAVGFVVDGRDTVVPMAVEESSVVAAASHGAKMAAAGGGFRTRPSEPITIGQVEVRGVRDLRKAAATVRRQARRWMSELDATIPRMVARGGGVRAVVPRPLGKGRLVVHLHVDTRDAMGANVVNGLCEEAGPRIASALGGNLGLQILSNLATERVTTASCVVPADALGGSGVVRAIVAANDFALADPYRAATHNKGILNGIDPVVIATGNDWRAVEAGAHSFAALDGAYRPLTAYRWNRSGDLEAELQVPLAVGTVGGVTRLHPVARACLRVLGEPDSPRLACIMAAAGLAQNLAALRALAAEGIQEGHMRLHAQNRAMARKAAS